MKILVIPDTHGDSSQWIKKNLSIYDQIVFMGDYFDSKTISFSRQMNAFEKILFAKDTFKEKVVLLIGNHELHYILNNELEIYSGYQHNYAKKLNLLLSELVHNHTLEAAHSIKNVLFTHAGLSRTFAQYIGIKNQTKAISIAKFLNELFAKKPLAFGFNDDAQKADGDDIFQSVLWIRPASLIKDHYPINQIVAHTSFHNTPYIVKLNNITLTFTSNENHQPFELIIN